MADFPETFTGVTFQFGIICCQASLWIMYKQPVLQTHFTFSPAFFSIKLVQQSLYMYDPVSHLHAPKLLETQGKFKFSKINGALMLVNFLMSFWNIIATKKGKS